MQLCFVVSHTLTTVSFCLKDSSLCCIASYDALRLIFYVHISSIPHPPPYLSFWARLHKDKCLESISTVPWLRCPPPVHILCLQQFINFILARAKQRETSQQHSLLVLTPLPSIALVSPQCALCALGARFIWMRTFLQSANHHPQTLYCTRVIFFCLVR